MAMKKIYIMSDMEGVSGELDWVNLNWRNPEPHRHGTLLLAGDLNAAIQGALDGGATEILVCDAHAGGGNIKPGMLIPPAKFLYPRGSEDYLPKLDSSYDCCFLVGAHAMAGTPGAHLCHTQTEEWIAYSINGSVCGEIAQVAAITGDYGVPIALVTAGSLAIAEARAILGDGPEYVTVKFDQLDGPPRLLDLEKALQLIRDAARRAVSQSGHLKPYKVDLPAKIGLRCATPEFAEKVVRISGSKRVDDLTIEFVARRQRDVIGKLFEHSMFKKLDPAVYTN